MGPVALRRAQNARAHYRALHGDDRSRARRGILTHLTMFGPTNDITLLDEIGRVEHVQLIDIAAAITELISEGVIGRDERGRVRYSTTLVHELGPAAQRTR